MGVAEAIILIISLAATATGTYMSYAASEQQARQSEMNSKAQSDAMAAEAAQRQQEAAEATRRKALEQHRFRATQLAEISGQGIQITGTPLEIMANRATQEQEELNAIRYQRDAMSRNLAYQGESALAMGAQQSAQYKQQAGATLLSGAASMAGTVYGANRSGGGLSYNSIQQSQQQYSIANTNYTPRKAG